LENTRLDTWNKITQIRKSTQDVENKRNMENAAKHLERMEMLRKIEESYDMDFGEVEKKAIQLMNIEEADELQNVKIYSKNKKLNSYINSNTKNLDKCVILSLKRKLI